MQRLTAISRPKLRLTYLVGPETFPVKENSLSLNVSPDGSVVSVSISRGLDFDGLDSETAEQAQIGLAKRLQQTTNSFVRWYRYLTKDISVSELSLAAMSPFHFEIDPPSQVHVVEPMPFESYTPRMPLHSPEAFVPRLRSGLTEGNEPPVADLFLLDAAQAIDEGRFREAVLFSWAVIDSVFNRGYARLVDKRLKGDLSEGIEELKDPRGGGLRLKTRMTVMMSLLANSSLKHEWFWEDLSSSYTKRNKIIHDGDVAIQEDAQRAYEVAQTVQLFMRTVEAENP